MRGSFNARQPILAGPVLQRRHSPGRSLRNKRTCDLRKRYTWRTMDCWCLSKVDHSMGCCCWDWARWVGKAGVEKDTGLGSWGHVGMPANR